MLFSDRSILTMVHGIVVGGGALLGYSAALYALRGLAGPGDAGATARDARGLSLLLVAIAVLLWLAAFSGTYVVFPPYRATPPEGVTDLGAYPRALLLSDPATAWLHRFAMEIKEHVPWIAAMLASAAAYVARRAGSTALLDERMRGMVTALTAIGFVLVSWIALLGVFVNKVAPLE
jgi:hypothetical protein